MIFYRWPFWKTGRILWIAGLGLCGGATARAAEEPARAAAPTRIEVQLAENPAPSPDGSRVIFDWKGDLWIGGSRGGRARRLTSDPGTDTRAVFSPDGQRIAFTSDRDGSYQVYEMPVAGGVPRQLTFHSEGSLALDWYPDGGSLLVRGVRDHAGRYPYRFYRVPVDGQAPAGVEGRPAPVLLFDASGREASLSPDGRRLLFTREGGDLYRKGYHGSQAAQIWLADGLEKRKPRFRRLFPSSVDTGLRSPQWQPDGTGFFYLGAHGDNGVFELRHFDLKGREDRQLTDSDGTFPILRPRLSADGSVVVFQRGFDLYRLDVAEAQPDEGPREPKRLRYWIGDDGVEPREDELRRILSKATNLSFSADGLEAAFIAGGDLWVMDTVLKEPRRVTATPEEEDEPVFTADGKALLYVRDSGTEVDIFKAERANAKAYWWLNEEFNHTRLTEDGEDKQDLQLVPGGDEYSYVRGRGDLWLASLEEGEPRRLVESWNVPSSSWSPDGQWLAYALYDDDFNRDIWILPKDGSREPFNLSRHPDVDSEPTWSPDGKLLAFTGRRFEDETDIYYVWLTREGEQDDQRRRTLREAIEKMKKERKPAPPPSPPAPAQPTEPEPEPKQAPEPDPKKEPGPDPDPKPAPGKEPPTDPPAQDEPEEEDGDDGNEKPDEEKKPEEPPAPKQPKPVKIDFDGIAERIHRISIPNSDESRLFWSHDSKRLAFKAEVKGVEATYLVTFPDKLSTPTPLSPKTGSFARWIAKDDTILWLVDGKPASLSKGKLVQHEIRALQTLDHSAYRREAFEQIWRTMRDHYYDGALNGLDWNEIHDRYAGAAIAAPDDAAFDDVVEMVLGELNGSHLGFSARSSDRPSSGPWKNETAHLGLRFDRFHRGEGLLVTGVLPEGPADRVGLRLNPGDVVLTIDGAPVRTGMDLTDLLNGPLDRDIVLEVIDAPEAKEADAGAEADEADEADEKAPAEPKPRTLRLRPISYAKARDLANDERIRQTREQVETASGGKLGYVYVPRMLWNEFVKFEEEIYARGAGREGLVIDVRDNGGGFTTDHLLTVLTPPVHAITVPRGGGPGYPQDRRVYAAWSKPIIVLCNQNSFSNAEIFAHAIQTLGRGKVVGVPTAGGVISTGSTSIMDVGSLRLPFRGWFLADSGEDMELNGAVPDVIVRNLPQDTAVGRDRQVDRAVELLLREVEALAKQPPVELRKASER